eukprot:TRINITY_DN10404_c0_g1_i10.p1 TRINITY_DN10404_c0_g1~~TRINITY_DN10404_c0_g1_i10.p1  ORF type:complete len:139 (+),score=9.53 TRINITY_DN10404_c0_g1_i10:77-493(+)
MCIRDRNNLAYVCILLKKNKEASDACSEAYNSDSGAKNYLRNWAIALLNQKLYSEAVEVIKEAIGDDPACYSTLDINSRELGGMGGDNESERCICDCKNLLQKSLEAKRQRPLPQKCTNQTQPDYGAEGGEVVGRCVD